MKKTNKEILKYADLSIRRDDINTKFHDFTLTTPTNTHMSVYQSGHKSFCPSGWHTKLNTYDHYIIHYILTGKGTYYAPSGAHPVNTHDLFLIKPSESIHYQADRLEPWTYYWVGFNGTEIPGILNLCGFSDSTLVRSYDRDNRFQKVMERLAYPTANGISQEYELLGNLYHMFSLLIETHTCEPLAKSVQYLNTAIEFIQQKYSYGDLRVSDVADYVGIDRTYLYRIFYEAFQMSVQDFILDLRMKKAKNLLKHADSSIGLVAYNCGFESQSYFSTTFRKRFGISPLQYRKRHGDNDPAN